jgi:Spy/CpxP family protein refolding chaperone
MAMMRRWFLMGCLVLIMGGVADAQPRAGARGGWRWWENPEIRQVMSLTDEQASKIREIARSRRDTMIDLRSAMEKKGLLLRDEVERADYDMQKALAAAEEFQKARRELGNARMKLLLEIRGVLNQKQFFTLRKIQREARERMWQGQSKGAPGPPPAGSR